MLIVLHHGDQQCFGQFVLSVVRLSPVQIEITQTRALERADITVKWLQLIVDVADVFLQISFFEERFLTLGVRT